MKRNITKQLCVCVAVNQLLRTLLALELTHNDFDNNIHRCMYKYFEMNNSLCKRIFPSIANLKCTPSIGKVALRVHVSQFGNPLFRIRG